MVCLFKNGMFDDINYLFNFLRWVFEYFIGIVILEEEN